jgi:hypothetical protein
MRTLLLIALTSVSFSVWAGASTDSLLVTVTVVRTAPVTTVTPMPVDVVTSTDTRVEPQAAPSPPNNVQHVTINY